MMHKKSKTHLQINYEKEFKRKPPPPLQNMMQDNVKKNVSVTHKDI